MLIILNRGYGVLTIKSTQGRQELPARGWLMRRLSPYMTFRNLHVTTFLHVTGLGPAEFKNQTQDTYNIQVNNEKAIALSPRGILMMDLKPGFVLLVRREGFKEPAAAKVDWTPPTT